MSRLLLRLNLAILALSILGIVGLRLAAGARETETSASLRPSEGRMVETDLGAVFVLERGPVDGPPVLLVHGSVGWSGLWEETLEHLASRGHRAFAFDLPPMGFSARDPASDYSRSTQARRLVALVDALDVRPVVVAHSFGAGPAAEALIDAPDAFAGAVFVDAAVGLGSHETTAGALPIPLRPMWVRETLMSATVTNPYVTRWLVGRFVHRRDAITDRHIEILQRPLSLEGTTQELARWLPTLLVAPLEADSTRPEAFADVAVPVALIWGNEDDVTPPRQGRELAEALGDAPILWLEDVGHIPQMEDPAAFHGALDVALAGMERVQVRGAAPNDASRSDVSP